MASKNKPSVEKHVRTTKSFTYVKDGVNLDFSLNVDNTKDIRAFKALLETAAADLQDLLNTMSN